MHHNFLQRFLAVSREKRFWLMCQSHKVKLFRYIFFLLLNVELIYFCVYSWSLLLMGQVVLEKIWQGQMSGETRLKIFEKNYPVCLSYEHTERQRQRHQCKSMVTLLWCLGIGGIDFQAARKSDAWRLTLLLTLIVSILLEIYTEVQTQTNSSLVCIFNTYWETKLKNKTTIKWRPMSIKCTWDPTLTTNTFIKFPPPNDYEFFAWLSSTFW